MAVYTSGTITAFEPQSTCFATSNLWLTTMPCGVEFTSDDQLKVVTSPATSSPICTVTMLGPPDRDEYECYDPLYDWAEGIGFNDCPVGMTSAYESTSDKDNGIKVIDTICCPSAYDFATRFDAVPPTDEEGYAYSTFFCRANTVKPLSDQTVTLTVSTAPLITTEAAWNYEEDFVYAYPVGFRRYSYEASGTSSECFGYYDCPDYSNPLAAPTPTPTPTNSYVPPPSHPTTQFTPAPSCIGDSDMYLVSTSCQILADNGYILTPDWLECSITEFGEWNTYNDACYLNFQSSTTVGDDGTASFYAGCPAGYTTASETTYRPFDKGSYKHPTHLAASTYDVVVSSVDCCPGGDYSFKLSDVHTTSTSVGDRYEYVDMYPMPRCVINNVKALSGKDVELTLAANNQAMDKRKRQEQTPGPEVTTRPWNYADGLLFAEAVQASVTVFHGTYSCYENCDDYFTRSYNNTDPNYTPTSTGTTTATSTGEAGQTGQGDATQSSAGQATQVSGASSTVKSTLFGSVVLLVTILSLL